MQEVTLKLTVEEVNLILEALSNMSFKHSYGIIGKIQKQASEAVEQAEKKGSK